MKKLAIITTHPIQYYAPVFKLLNERQQINIRVFYTLGKNALDNYDSGFGKKITWDIPLLDGYPYEWVLNASANPGSHHFNGINNPDLIDQVNNWKPDVLLVFGWAYRGHLKAVHYFKNKIPVLFRGDSTLLDETGGIKGLFKSIFLRWVYRHIDCAFYTGINNKAYFKKYGLKESQLSFASHAIDNERFSFERKNEVALLRQNLGLMPNDLLVLFAGKLEEKKDPILLHDAFISLNNHAIHLLFVGDGVLKKQLKAKAQYYNNIHFIDFQNQTNMPVIYQSCDLFCLPSKGPAETWGLSVNEAMACGKAILVSDKVGCAADLVKEGINGSIFKTGSLQDLKEKLWNLTEDKNRLLKFGEQSQLLIKDWNFLNIAKALENKLLHNFYPTDKQTIGLNEQ